MMQLVERLLQSRSLPRVAKLGFWFFLIKGLLWLLLPFLLLIWGGGADRL